MASLKRLWYRLTSFSRIVGRDLEGNQFYEYPSPHGNSFKTKRVVKYARRMELWEYPQAQRRLPVQWTMWLTHTRPHAPTVEELQADAIRQARVKYNVAMIQAREAEAHMPRLNEPELARPAMTEPAMTEPSPTRRYQVGSFASTPTPQPEARFTPERLAPETTARANTEEPSKPSPWEAADKLVESQAWTPAVGRRRG